MAHGDYATTSAFVSAYAKVNLTLAVLGRREDGYHRLASVMQTISLCDTLHLRLADDQPPQTPTEADTPPITFHCDSPELSAPEENLAYRAARLLQAEALASTATSGEIVERIRRGLTLELRKAIPTQAGLGGGSSDAAAVLASLNALWELGLPATRLEALAATLGSDVPFFIGGGAALIEGRGEFVAELPDVEPFWLILLKPRIGVSTAAVFQALTPADYGDEAETLALVSAIRTGAPLAFERLTNTLEAGVTRTYPAVGKARAALLAAGAPVVRMSGSGPTLFAPFHTLVEASAVYQRIQKILDANTVDAPYDAWLCHTISRARYAHSRPTLS